MTAHCVAPQQSLMMATPDLVMDGLLGGGSRICLLGFGGSCRKDKEKRNDHTMGVRVCTTVSLSDCELELCVLISHSLCAALSLFSRGISFSLRNSAISLSSSRSLRYNTHTHTHALVYSITVHLAVASMYP